MIQGNSLLTPKEVANLLQISPRTVYDRAGDLGGFYPAGIRVLRFRPEIIGGYLEGQDQKGLAIQLPVQGGGVRRGRPRKQARSNGGQGEEKRITKKISRKGDDRHGLFRYSQAVS